MSNEDFKKDVEQAYDPSKEVIQMHKVTLKEEAIAALREAMDSFSFNGMHVPYHTRDTLSGYLFEGWQAGHFVSAVLDNDLYTACAHADIDNMRNLPAIAAFIYNYFPAMAYGSTANRMRYMSHVDEWSEDVCKSVLSRCKLDRR